MDARNHALVLYFDPNHEATQQRVRDCLTRLSPGSAGRMDALMKRGRVVLKRNADPDKDQRIVELLAEAGGVCRFESVDKSPIAKPKNDTLSAKEMVCPKCNLIQRRAAECRHCGLIIEKFKKQVRLAKPPTPMPQAPLKSVLKPAESRPGLWSMLPRSYGPSIEKAWRWLKGNPLGDEKVQQWSQRVADAIFRCVVVSVVALALEVGLLYLARMVWFVYTSTTVGQVYLDKFGNDANAIQYLMQSNMAMVGWTAVVTALVLCILVGIVAQWFHLIRFLYLPFGIVGHTVLWILPLTGLSAWYLHMEEVTNQIGLSCAVTILPTLLLLSCSIHLVQTTIPEMGTVIRIGKNATGGWDAHLEGVKNKMRNWWEEVSKS